MCEECPVLGSNTPHHGQVGSIPALYSEGPGFYFRSGHQIPLLQSPQSIQVNDKIVPLKLGTSFLILLLLQEGDIRLFFFAAVQFRVFLWTMTASYPPIVLVVVLVVFGLASLTSLMNRCSALLTCSFHAFLLLLTNFTTSCKLHRSRMSWFTNTNHFITWCHIIPAIASVVK